LVLFILGGLGGYLLLPGIEQPFALNQVTAQHNKVLLFVGSSDRDRFIKVLDKAENLMQRHPGDDVEVTIVASGGGIDMLRNRVSPYQQRIHSMADEYDRLSFVACNSTLERLRRKGKPVNLVDQAIVAPSAVEFVVDRLREGWSYVAI
jgi:intracellular sulfur oxidation DsrE/DsrF family protein